MDYDARLFGEEVSRFLAIVAVVVLLFGSVEGGYMDSHVRNAGEFRYSV
jgi:hypothetical protein